MKPSNHKGKISAIVLAVALIGAYEGLSEPAYLDIVGIPTICYGETKGVKLGDTKTKSECDAILVARIQEFNEELNQCIKTEVPDTFRISMVSLAYNNGAAAVCSSSIPRKIAVGDLVGACKTMLEFNKVCIKRDKVTKKCLEMKIIKGLDNRRKSEYTICVKDLKPLIVSSYSVPWVIPYVKESGQYILTV